MYGSTIHAFLNGRVDLRGFAPRRMISVRGGERRAIYACVRTCISTLFSCMRGELRSVHTLGSLYLRTINALVVEKPNQAGAQQQGSWALFTGHTWIKPQRRAVAATFLGDYEHFHRRRTPAQASQPSRPHKSPHIGLGDFRETHRGVLGGVSRIIS